MEESIEDIMSEVASRFNLGEVREHHKFESGIVNDVYYLQTSKDEVVVKVLGYDLDPEERRRLELEQEVLEHLRNKDFSYDLPYYYTTSDGSFIQEIGDENVLVCNYIEGRIPERLSKEELRKAGKFLAKYHREVSDMEFDRSYEPESFDWLQEQLEELEERTSGDTADQVSEMKEVFQELIARDVRQRYIDAGHVLPNHSDITYDNLVFRNDEIVGVLDFDNMRIQPRLGDIAWTTTLEAIFNVDESDLSLYQERKKAFLSGYEEVESLDEEEVENLDLMVVYMIVILFQFDCRNKLDEEGRDVDLAKYCRAARSLIKTL